MQSKNAVTKAELNVKLERIHKLLSQRGLDALLLRRFSNFAWATCGAACYINTAERRARLTQEEGLADQGWEFVVSPWYERKDKVSELTRGMKLGADSEFPNAAGLGHEMASLRFALTSEEGERFRTLGMLCAKGMRKAIDDVRPGMTEYEIAAALSQAVEGNGVQAIVNLIATDERLFSYRHPLPTSKKLERYVMLILCGRKWGLICSLTRLIYFGSLPDEVRRKSEAVAQIDADMIAATRPGFTMGDVFQKAQSGYAAAGFPDEWQRHHQGGLAGYAPREVTVVPGSAEPVLVGQAYAWNPSIAGAKSEDTILVGEQTNEVITEMADWPYVEVEVSGERFKRPAVLEKE